MIKARTKNAIILGLSDLNLEKLKEGKPIKFNITELNQPDKEPQLPDILIFIFNGKDEDTMTDMLLDIHNQAKTKSQ